MKSKHAWLVLLLSACSAVSTESPQVSTTSLNPDTDEITMEEFNRVTGQGFASRGLASIPLKLPSDYEPGKIFSLVKEPSVLLELERRGFSLAQMLDPAGQADLSNREFLATSRPYASIVEVLDRDLDQLTIEERRARDPKKSTEKLTDEQLLAKRASSVGPSIDYSVRIFDQKWFRASIAEYQLVGVVNRLDRVAFNPQSCGELRLLYRLSYDFGEKKSKSRLPMTVLVKFQVDGKAGPSAEWEKCKRMVSTWTYPETDATGFVDWMVSAKGPLAQEFVAHHRLHSVEVNLQALRIPSSMRPEFGGHGNYLMRVFKPEGDRMVPAKLENTPDVPRILADANLHGKLKSLVRDRRVVNRIDNGIFQLPEEFLAERAYSFSPMGLGRADNRLYNKLLGEGDFDPAHFQNKPRYVKTPASAIKRLNDLSCVGCHQGRATAGFHFLGIDREDTHMFNALAFEGSGHFQLELKRRARYLERVAKGLVPDPSRDFSFSPPEGEKAGINHFCGLKDAKAFAHWQCEEKLQCVKIDGAAGEMELGKCLPKPLVAGSPCVVGEVSQGNHRSDGLVNTSKLVCGNGKKRYGCSEVKGGFPSGMCNTPCSGVLPESETCGQVAGKNFSECVAKNRPFEECLDDSSFSGRGLCSEDSVCRNDYVCSRTKEGKGNCTPSYFLFQIRLDAHQPPI